ncbi:MAG: hypothetical protein AB1765_13075 [Candidatus Hydrogenedentota bacterium]
MGISNSTVSWLLKRDYDAIQCLNGCAQALKEKKPIRYSIATGNRL